MRKVKRIPPVVSNTYPMRINKYLAHKGVATRTGVDDLISHNKVLINGRLAKLGDKVMETDKVEVRGVHTKKKLIYLAYNKPKGVVTANPQRDEKDILSNLILTKGNLGTAKLPAGVFPIGRLDKESYGLLILANDGRITDRLLNPIYEHEKEYIIEVDRRFTPGFLKNMQDGVKLSDGKTKPADAKRIDDSIFSLVLTEGRNRQIRRMTEKLGYTVRDLKRTRIQNIELGKLPTNSHREITGEELETFLKSINLSS